MPKKKQKGDLTSMSLDELRAKFQEVTGEETTDRSKKRLIERIEAELQSIAVLEQKQAEGFDAESAPDAAPKKKGRKNPAEDADDGDKTSKLTVEELRARYTEIVGRESKSTNRRYLIWRVKQAERGRIRVGPRAGRGSAGPMKVLPVRVPAAAVEPLTLAQKRLQLRSRNEMIVQALRDYLAQAGEDEVAAFFADPDAA